MDNMQVVNDYLIIKLPQEIDHHYTGRICKKADELILYHNVSAVVFDFEDTEFMDSSGIGMVLGRCKKMDCLGGRVYIWNIHSQIKKIFILGGLEQMVLFV